MQRIVIYVFVGAFVSTNSVLGQLPSGWKAHDLRRPAPAVVVPGEKPGDAPSDAIVLFDGNDLSKWTGPDGGEAKWKIVEGAIESVPNSGYIFSKEKFGDCQLHVEFSTPALVKADGQGRGNSGVFLMGLFEVQVLDSFENATYPDGSAGSIYGQYPPLVNASRRPGQWQTFDIIFRRPRFDSTGKLTQPAMLTVIHNGIVVQNGSEAFGPTRWIQHADYEKTDQKLPLSLQDHGDPVRYRNIWIRPLVETRSVPADPYDPVTIELTREMANRLVGKYGDFPVKYENGKLMLIFNQIPLEMVAHSQTEFGFAKSAGIVTFQLDENGEGVSMTFELDAVGKKMGKRTVE